MQCLETRESKLLLELKTVNGALEKQLKGSTGEYNVKVAGLNYNRKRGGVEGNKAEVMILVSVGDEYPADLVASKRIKNPSLAKKGTKMFGSLPVVVPGLHEEAAADLMAAASTQLKSPNLSVVQILVDVPMMQRSKQYYLKKIETFFQNCKEQAGML